MLTRKEELFVKPFQQRLYHQHKIKISIEEQIEIFNDTVRRQEQETKDLNEKIEATICERDCLLDEQNKFNQWKEKIISDNAKLYAELSNSFNVQAEEKNELSIDEITWKMKFDELQSINICLADRLKTIESNEIKFQAQLAETEEQSKLTHVQKCSIKSKLEEKNRQVNELYTDLKSSDEELCRMRRIYKECAKERSVLNTEKMNLETNLNRTKSELNDVKSSASRAEGKFKAERDPLSDELKTTCKQLDCLETRYEEANRKLNEEKSNVGRAMKTLMELNDTFLREHDKLKNEAEKLRGEICTKENSICRLKRKVKQLQRCGESTRDQTSGRALRGDKYPQMKPPIRSLDAETEETSASTPSTNASITSANTIVTSSNASNTSTNNSKSNACFITDSVNAIIRKYATKSDDGVEKDTVRCDADDLPGELNDLPGEVLTIDV